MPKFTITVTDSREKPWIESYDKNVPDPRKWAEETIAKFNASLRPGERPRTLVKVVITGSSDAKHSWEKTNLVTILRGTRMYDTYKCAVCGITGKRYTLGSPVERDAKFAAKKFAVCKSPAAQGPI